MPLKNKYKLLIILFIMVPSFVLIVLTNFFMKRMAYLEAYDKMNIMMTRTNAIHEYINQVARPVIFELMDEYEVSETYFRPEIMSSTYAVREINKIFNERIDENYYFKEIADFPRNPENQADDYEKEILQLFNLSSDITVHTRVMERNGVTNFVYIKKGEVLEENCLRCHSVPEKAPQGLLDIYGENRGFHKTVGEIVSAQSVAIPLSEAYATANRFSMLMAVIALIVVFLASFIFSRVTETDIFLRLDQLNQYFSGILTGKQRIGERFLKTKNDELGDLFKNFNRMSLTIKNYENLLEKERDKLKEQVDIKTHDLEQKFIELQKLHKVANCLAQEKNEQSVYRLTLEAVEEIMGYRYSLISIMEDNNVSVKMFSSHFESNDINCLVEPLELKANETFNSGETTINYYSSTDLLNNRYRVLINTPLESIGVLQILLLEERGFTDDQAYMIELTAGYAGETIKRIRMDKILWEQAVKDGLTGLYNRNFFNEVIVNEIYRSERDKKVIGLIMVDINRFKEVNDRYGHVTGDLILKEVAILLQETLRKNDWVVRFGGDEYLIVLPNCKSAKAVKDKIEKAVQDWNHNNNILDFDLTLAIGTAQFIPGSSKRIEEVLKIADENMYIDKKLKYQSK
ncbi:diguanylate cyclase [Candidatus Contubernalis alkaliaceticus]|uniref:diguanylate cyclase n=1 Tax=Candidatus Contubernalis alkaliaceticus TaxID=338645 RepID=UPI001F4BFE87|nr:diguanylate cyclase [Candidatus Contubernalis alkalaceticus]UNC91933.1 diguanylate cyclase [Candidatus Contubernalis alkalaceticus]